MYHGWFEYAGVELMNAARSQAYVTSLMRIESTYSVAGLRIARGHSAYVSPAADGAPWYVASRPALGRFYGLFPKSIEGADNSTRTVEVTEMPSGGAVHSPPRRGPMEIRVVAHAFAADEEAMSEGLAWVRDILSSGECFGSGCSNNTARFYTSQPVNGGSDNHMVRTLLKVEVLDNLRITESLPSKRGIIRKVEFIFSVAVPRSYASTVTAGTLTLASGASFTDPANEDCYLSTNPYTDFINDAFYTAISQPPAAPRILPPNVAKVSTWRRSSLAVTQANVDRWGVIHPILTVVAGAGGAKQVRLRFYGGSASGCAYEGEFLISYIPPNATMVLDARTREVVVTKSNGTKVPGGHLVYGSDGLPPLWPDLGCSSTYTMHADMLAGQTGITVKLDSAVGE